MDKKWIIDNVLPRLEKTARKLEILKLREILLGENNKQGILAYLDNLQNEDGGFPGYLEPDVRSSNSTVIATQIALDNYYHCGGIKNLKVKTRIEEYLNSKFNHDEMRWNIISGDITNAPRGFWWNPKFEKTFGYSNPSSIIVALAIKLELNVNPEFIKYVIDKTLETELSNDNIHDHLSIIKMLDYLNIKYPKSFIDAGEKLIVFDTAKWVNYVPTPTDVITNINHPLYIRYKKQVNEFLDYQLEILEKDFMLSPKWTWRQYEEHFDESIKDWQGVLTLRLIENLVEFNKI